VLKVLDELMADATAGDPISGLKWTHKSLSKIQRTLRAKGYRMSRTTISRLLRQQDYSLRVNCKRVAGQQSEGRDQQFSYVTRWRQRFLRQHKPVISVDAKKKEMIGNFKNAGTEWRVAAREVNIYDFPSQAHGKAIVYGIYDVGCHHGYVSVGISHDTPAFAVAAIRAWWIAVGQKAYPGQTHLLIEADCGGSNGNRCRLWIVRLQAFADEFGLTTTVTHDPTGASKWNPIEHRMFNLISGNWAGQPLDSYETMLKHIRTTRSTTGFRCQARLDRATYPTGVTVTPEEFARVRLKRHKLFPQWNYTIYPHPKKSNT